MMNIRISLVLFAGIFLAACASGDGSSSGDSSDGDGSTTNTSVERVDEVTASGFLGDYSNLRKGKENEASLVYWNQQVDMHQYSKIIIDPITIWLGGEGDLRDISPQERQALANEFHAAVVEKVGQHFEIVDTAGPGTMRLRIALTDAAASNATLDTISTYVPQARLLSSIVTMGSDTGAFVGEATAEAEIRDAITGTLLVAAVDRRAGTKSLGDDTLDSWGDVRAAFDFWANRISSRLKEKTTL
jgi:hypothetical protein